MRPTLDQQITGAFSVVGLLIAIVTGYLAAVWPVVAGLLDASRPEVDRDRRALSARCRAYSRACGVFAFIAALVLSVMLPLAWKVAKTFDVSESLSTVRSGVVLFVVLMGAAVTVGVVLSIRLHNRAAKLWP